MHSENGLILNRAYEGMPQEWRDQVNLNVLFTAYNPVLPISDKIGLRAINIYSKKDYLILGFKIFWDANATYEIEMVDCISEWHEKSAFIYDHAFLSPTGKQATDRLTQSLRKEYGFHTPSTR